MCSSPVQRGRFVAVIEVCSISYIMVSSPTAGNQTALPDIVGSHKGESASASQQTIEIWRLGTLKAGFQPKVTFHPHQTRLLDKEITYSIKMVCAVSYPQRNLTISPTTKSSIATSKLWPSRITGCVRTILWIDWSPCRYPQFLNKAYATRD